MVRHFNTPHKKITWGDIQEEKPDEWDAEMIRDIETNPDCKTYISHDELIARRMARKKQATTA
jgi:hypothetical protein